MTRTRLLAVPVALALGLALVPAAPALAAPSKAVAVGTVVDNEGDPVASSDFLLSYGEGGYEEFTTDEDGDFRVSSRVSTLGRGNSADVAIQQSGSDAGSFQVHMRNGTTTDVGTVVWDEDGAISGSVSLPDSERNAYAYLVDREGRTVAYTEVDVDSGDYVFGFGTPGEYTVQVRGPLGWAYLGGSYRFGKAHFTSIIGTPTELDSFEVTAFTGKLRVEVTPSRGKSLSTQLLVQLAGGRQEDVVSAIVKSGTHTVLRIPAGKVILGASSYKARTAYYTGSDSAPSTSPANAERIRIREGKVTRAGDFEVAKKRFQTGWV
jgi:hypothetical protein